MARLKKMSTVTRAGSRLDQLKNLAAVLAGQIDDCRDMGNAEKSAYLITQLSRQYRDTIREIEEIEGVSRENDEIGELLSAREADGKSDAVR